MASSWKVELIGTEDETPLDTTTLDGRIYFHADPGRCFRVKVSNTESRPSSKKLIINLWIDGGNVGYANEINLSKKYRSVIFDGIYKMNKIYDFKFSETQLADASEIHQETAKSSGTASDFSAGSIGVDIFEAEEDMTAEPNIFTPPDQVLPSENKKIDKDKKFWTQPSVTTACADEGRLVKPSPPIRPWKRASDIPLFAFTGYYHTPGLIKILQNMGQSSSSSSSLSGKVPPSSALNSAKRLVRDTEVIDLTGDDCDYNQSGSSLKKHRRSNQSSSKVV